MKTVEESYDVVVVGGGFAGTFAAVSAARLGCRVALIHDRSVLGGNGSSEIGVGMAGADCSGTGWVRYARETGLVGEYSLELLHRARTPQAVGPLRSVVLWEMVRREKNLTLHLNAAMREAVVDSSGAIAAVRAYQHSTERHYLVAGRLFVDCTGHGTLGAAAGAVFRMGREGREEFGEPLAPPRPDKGTMGATVTFRARNVGRPVPFQAPEWAAKFPTDESLPFRHPKIEPAEGVDEMVGFWWVEYGGQRDSIGDSEEIHDELLRVVFGIWDHMKNTGDHGVANWELTWLCPLPGPRESRRLVGDAMPTERDVRGRTLFADRVAYAGWSIDLHPPEGIYSPDPPNRGAILSGLWSIPFRSLYSRNVPNLMMAGRDVSVSHVALGSSRVIATCGLMGQAAGTAAALCLREGLSPRQLGAQRIEELQQQLLRDDCYLVDLPNRDERDLARAATATASSEAELTVGEADDWQALDRPWAQLLPVSADRVDAVELLLRPDGAEATPVRLHLRAAEQVNDFESTEDLATCEARVSGGQAAWVRFPLNVRVKAGRFYWVHLEPARGVAWALQHVPPHATNRAEGAPGQEPPWRSIAPKGRPDLRRGGFLVRLHPGSRPYGPANVLSGVNRPERWTNLWISDPRQALPQWLELTLPQAREIARVQLTLDDDLDGNIYHPRPWGKLGEGEPATLLKDYRVSAWCDGRWRTVVEVTGNHQRHRVHDFPPVRTDRIRLDCLQTHGRREARVYGIRLYGP